MTTSTTTFQPKVHGFKFPNDFSPTIKIDIPLIGPIAIENIVRGLCGGMCFVALDYFHHGEPVPPDDEAPATGTDFHIHLVKKQIESLIPPDGLIDVLRWTAQDDGYVGLHTGGREFGKLRTRVDKGQPVVLALIRADRGEDPRRNHQVVAHAYHLDDQTRDVEIEVYDPNHPGKEPSIFINIRERRRGINARQSTGEPLRGFFLIDYRLGKLPSLNS